MPFKQQDIDELKWIYEEEFGKPLTNDDAWAMAHRLLQLYRRLYTRYPWDKSER